MRASGRLAARVLDYAGSLVRAGVTTDEIDRAVHKMIVEHNAYPSPLNYGKFPKSCCTSVNECVCHGIPDDRPLQDGDILNIDITVFLDGYHGDTSRMFYVGERRRGERGRGRVAGSGAQQRGLPCGAACMHTATGGRLHAWHHRQRAEVMDEPPRPGDAKLEHNRV